MSSIFIGLLLLMLTACVNMEDINRNLFIKRDAFDGFLSGKFSVYDQLGNELQYRIESRPFPKRNTHIITYPSKQTIAKLRAQWIWRGYFATLSILEPHSNHWVDGIITSRGDFSVGKYYIEWNGARILMSGQAKSETSNFIDLLEDIPLTTSKRDRRFLTTSEYELKMFSDRYLEALYLISLAVWDSLHPGLNGGKI